MSANEVVHTSETGAKKAGNLERFDLIPPWPWMLLNARVTGQGGYPLGDNDTLFRELDSILLNWWARSSGSSLPSAAALTVSLIANHLDIPVKQLPGEPLRLLALHYGRGSLKYDDNNWRLGYRWGLSYAALQRHLWQHRTGQPVDEETGSLHLVAVLWHLFALMEFTQTHPELDDRWKTPQ